VEGTGCWIPAAYAGGSNPPLFNLAFRARQRTGMTAVASDWRQGLRRRATLLPSLAAFPSPLVLALIESCNPFIA